jgi:acyl-CoA reductase-like NAD-dependent aldehyde dehydrogenase
MQSPPLDFAPLRWVSPVEDRSFASINPSNLEKLADIPAAGEADVDAAVAAAKAGFRGRPG